MKASNISLFVEHDTSEKSKVFSEDIYSSIIERLSKFLTIRYKNRLKDVRCDNIEHRSFQTEIIINAANKAYEITKVCCTDYEDKINTALINVENKD